MTAAELLLQDFDLEKEGTRKTIQLLQKIGFER